MNSTLNLIKIFTVAVALVSVAACLPVASASIIDDDFESYGSTADLDAVWAVTSGTNTDTFLDTDPLDPLNQVVTDSVNTSRRSLSFTPFSVSGSETFVWSFDFYDYVGSASDPRNYGQLLSQASGGGLNELLAMGMYNAAGPVHDATKYQARVAFGGPNWFNLNTDRSVGWHNFAAVIGASTLDFYVDGALDTAGVSHGGFEWYEARIGSGLSSTGGQASYDNYLLTPEPASLTLLMLGGLLAFRRR